jgi:hypothetical protein
MISFNLRSFLTIAGIASLFFMLNFVIGSMTKKYSRPDVNRYIERIIHLQKMSTYGINFLVLCCLIDTLILAKYSSSHTIALPAIEIIIPFTITHCFITCYFVRRLGKKIIRTELALKTQAIDDITNPNVRIVDISSEALDCTIQRRIINYIGYATFLISMFAYFGG